MSLRSIQSGMAVRSHLHITRRALWKWFLAQAIDSLCVALLWLIGLLALNVPWAPLWAVLAAGFQWIPHVGGLLSLMGPLFAALVDGARWQTALYLLVLYVAIMLVDGLILQPLLNRRMSKVPLWASIVVPVVLGYFLNFWGVLLSAPLLAVFYAVRLHHRDARELPPAVEVIPPLVGPRPRPATQPPIIEG
jgi:predicted PurR-regulated permease PerM